MTKQEYLAMSLPYGLLVKNNFSERVVTFDGAMYHVLDEDTFNSYTPILRRLSDFTNECVQSDYNKGESFIPMLEFEFLATCDADRNWISSVLKDFSSVVSKLEVAPFHFVKLLIKWHFDLIAEDCENVYVTEDFNPYK